MMPADFPNAAPGMALPDASKTSRTPSARGLASLFFPHASTLQRMGAGANALELTASRSAGERIVDGHTSRRSSARCGLIPARFVGVAERNVTLESSSLLTEMRAPAIHAVGNARAKTPGATGAERESAKRWLGVMGRPLAAAPVTSHAAHAAVRQAP